MRCPTLGTVRIGLTAVTGGLGSTGGERLGLTAWLEPSKSDDNSLDVGGVKALLACCDGAGGGP